MSLAAVSFSFSLVLLLYFVVCLLGFIEQDDFGFLVPIPGMYLR